MKSGVGEVKPVDPSIAVEGVAGARRAYIALDSPALLAGMPHPDGSEDWATLAEAGFESVISLCEDPPDYRPSPLNRTWLPLQDLYGGGEPVDPERDRANIRAAAELVVAELRAGTGVLVHCVGGRGRTGTVLGVAMVQLGISPETVETWLAQVHQLRGREGWPESDWQRRQLRETAQDSS
jgi:hypothetical protein